MVVVGLFTGVVVPDFLLQAAASKKNMESDNIALFFICIALGDKCNRNFHIPYL